MLLRCIKSELLKLKGSKIWLLVLIIPTLGVLLGAGNYYMNIGMLTKEWFSLWTQVSLFYSAFFYPAVIAVCAAYLCRLEHLNKNWNRTMTVPVTQGCVYLGKLTAASLLVIAVQLVMVAGYLLAGYLFGFRSALPFEFWGWILRGTLGAITLTSLQVLLSIKLRSFATSVGICLFGCIAGFGIFLKASGMYFPYSFIAQGMCAVSQGGLTTQENLVFVCMNLLYLGLFSIIATVMLSRQDVKA